MAKSLRSKWKRKMRAEKRVRYGEKEKAKLVKMLDDFKKSEEEKEKHQPQTLGQNMDTQDNKQEGDDDNMDTSDPKARHSASSKKNEFGSYPVWMSNRKIQAAKGKKKKAENKVNKRHKKKFM